MSLQKKFKTLLKAKNVFILFLAYFLALNNSLPLLAQSSEILRIQQAETQTILAALNSRPVEWFQLKKHPQIYVLDFDSYLRQANTFNRIAAFVELQDVPHDRVLGHAELREILQNRGVPWDRVYVAHDYRINDLARFFNLAQALNADEQRLLQHLAHASLLIANQKGWEVKQNAAILSIAESAPQSTRRWALEHEIRHGRFFTEPDYQQKCTQFWQALQAPQRQAFRDMLSQSGYDATQEDLMINETQAYLLANAQSLRKRGLDLSQAKIKRLQQQLLKQLGEWP